ncbi:hypothetical protein [Anaerosporobacter faecicola]|uniref:hypothetical protein n=1 Tax=Anaerosporobacter faecicola TaxID=2718714 RepID=UPI00143A1355|nr:hypothetical protein [Anaerosporobacter faecicola]
MFNDTALRKTIEYLAEQNADIAKQLTITNIILAGFLTLFFIYIVLSIYKLLKHK